jgi:hypothetical protein
MNLATLVRVKTPFAGATSLVRHSSDGIGANRPIHLLAWHIRECVAALAPFCQTVVDKAFAALRRAA